MPDPVRDALADDTPPPVALVLLEAEPRRLSTLEIDSAVARALGSPGGPRAERPEGMPGWMLEVEGYVLTLTPTDRPYLPQDRAPSPVPQLREVIERQRAAVLFDCWEAPTGFQREDATGLMGRILVELFGEHSLGVYCFHTQRVNPVDAKLTALFREGGALEAMSTETYKQVRLVSADDPRMAEAIREAQRQWPEFVRAFAERTPGSDGYGFKARFGEDDHYEHLWVEAQEVDDNGASGTVMTGPLYLLEPRAGARVHVSLENMSDWGYWDGDRRGGGFSDEVVRTTEES